MQRTKEDLGRFGLTREATAIHNKHKNYFDPKVDLIQTVPDAKYFLKPCFVYVLMGMLRTVIMSSFCNMTHKYDS